MKALTDGDLTTLYPVIGWQTIVSDDAQTLFLLMIEFARNRQDVAAPEAGRDAPTIPLGFTADGARKLAADLLAAADAMESPRPREA